MSCCPKPTDSSESCCPKPTDSSCCPKPTDSSCCRKTTDSSESCCPTDSSGCPKPTDSDIASGVKDYYGKVLKSKDDLLTPACKTPVTSIPKNVRDVMSQIHDEVVSKYYGCGICVPPCLTNMNVVDLGSGSGRDCYVLSKLVGQQGSVIGVDITDEQLSVANKYVDYHTKKFGFDKPNVRFLKGFIEDLQKVGIEDNSIDIIISNCVVNLCEDKRKVMNEIYRILKFGGEMYFSDVYCDRQLPESVQKHQLLWNECVSGALFWEDLNKFAIDLGFEVPRIYSAHTFEISKPELKEVVGDARFISVIYRLFKLDKSKRESGNKQVTYKGGMEGCEDNLKLDYKLNFPTGTPVSIDDVTWNIIHQSRLNDFFDSKKAPCCAAVDKVEVENPFVVVEREGFTKAAGSCC